RASVGNQPALLMMPDEDPLAQTLEQFRDVPRDEFQQRAGALISRGYQLTDIHPDKGHRSQQTDRKVRLEYKTDDIFQ
ncbi:hypothetical protein, partial [Salmonella sp. SAL4447]|uniref:hypothetical protein n=1 Tax=Salmonella sp. SAL4447 TaxID=3159902 RepID=UPI003979EF6A